MCREHIPMQSFLNRCATKFRTANPEERNARPIRAFARRNARSENSIGVLPT
jgi:hypothetical protein